MMMMPVGDAEVVITIKRKLFYDTEIRKYHS